jgi:hypothetical protein
MTVCEMIIALCGLDPDAEVSTYSVPEEDAVWEPVTFVVADADGKVRVG